MKILIGTPIHQLKDYCLERWLKNVAELQKVYPADLLLVDNSPGLEYREKVQGYLEKVGIQNWQIDHFELNNADQIDEIHARSVRVEVAQEMIRQQVLAKDYDAWFSWECDQIVPADTLTKLVKLMMEGNYMVVVANSWARTMPGELNANMGVTLISRLGLELASFVDLKDGQFDLSSVYNVDEMMFKKRILKSGGNYIEIYGVIEPIYHLDK